MNLVIFGAPASGKGTHSKLLAANLGITAISTGDLVRDQIAKNTELGQRMKKFNDDGKLVPDELVTPLLLERIQEKDCKRGFILDGFPRTVEQKKELEAVLRLQGEKVDGVISLDVPEEELIRRNGERLEKAKNEGKTPRTDDTPEKFKNMRLPEYEKWTLPVLGAFRADGVAIQNIDASGEIAQTAAKAAEAAKQLRWGSRVSKPEGRGLQTSERGSIVNRSSGIDL